MRAEPGSPPSRGRAVGQLLGPNVSASLFQPLDHVIELIEITVADAERAATAAALIDTDGQAERICQAFLRGERVRILGCRAVRAPAACFPALLRALARHR